MKILITGCEGQLGKSFQKLAISNSDHSFTFIDINDLDLTESSRVETYLSATKPEVIINCAAYTAVDKAESEPEAAMAVNATVPTNLAKVCAAQGIRLVHISTDYVFDGKNYVPYAEDYPVSPVSAYGKSKYEGEAGILKHNVSAIIIRTSWLYSSYGKNFVKTIMEKGKELGKLKVVYDQVGGPTYAGDLAEAILEILPGAFSPGKTEIYHYANEGVISWYDFSKAIIETAGIDCTITPIVSGEYPVAAARPFYSVFNKSKIKTRFGIGIPYWKDSLVKCIQLIRNS